MNAFVVELMAIPNPLAGERIVCGLLAVTPHNLFFDYSRSKLRTAEAAAPEDLNGYYHALLRVLHPRLLELKKEAEAGLPHGVNKALLDYLTIYDDGALRFGEPQPITVDLTEAQFTTLFNATVDPTAAHPRRIERRLEKLLSDRPALRERVDIGYTLPDDKLPGLIVPARVGMITVNGAITAAQGCDLTMPEKELGAQLGTTERIQSSLTKYGKAHNRPVELLKLVVSFKVGTPSADLALRLKAEKSDVFEVLTLEEFQETIDRVEEDASYRKFSALIGE